MSETLVPVRCPREFKGRDALIEPMATQQSKYFAVARSLCQPKGEDNIAIVKGMNIKNHAFVLKRGHKIGTIQNINIPKDCQPFVDGPRSQTDTRRETVDRKALEDYAAEYGFQINPDLTEQQRSDMLNLLYEYKDVFAKMQNITGYLHYQLKLQLRDHIPSYQKQYKLTPEDALEVERQSTIWLRAES